MNTQHDCHRNGCQTSGICYVYQERIRTDITTPVVEHLINPNDLILNTAQMRDAVHLQKFRIPSTPLNKEIVIQESVARAIDQRKMAGERASGSCGGRGQGRGGQGGRGQGHGLLDNSIPSDRARGHGRGCGRGRGHGLVQPGEVLLDFNVPL